MPPSRNVARSRLAALAVCLIFAASADAQLYTVRPPNSPAARPQAPFEKSETEVSVELLLDDNAAGLHAQDWNRVFQQLQVPVRIRRSLLDEKLRVDEQKIGTLRYVKVIGRLGRGGELVFADRKFTRSDTGKLSEWLRELQTFGAQGSPEGQPIWGLNKAQFAELYAALGEPLENEVEDLPLEQAVAQFAIPQRYLVRLSAAAREWMSQESSLPAAVGQEVEGFTKGTALAIVLNNFGLGFKPQRTPEGEVELVIEPLEQSGEFWPIGWELTETRQQTAPKLFEYVPVELDNVRLLDVLAAISAQTGIAIFHDEYRPAKYGIDLENLKVSYPQRRTIWFIVLRGLTNPAKLSHELKIDEAGRPFVWVSTLKIGEFGR